MIGINNFAIRPLVTMVTILETGRWGLNNFDPRRDDRDVTVTPGSPGGFGFYARATEHGVPQPALCQ